MLLTVAPVQAASPATLKDTVDREKISVTAVHTITATTVPTWANGESLLFDYATAGFTLTAGAISTCTPGSGTCSATVSSTNSVVVTCTAAANCSGSLTVGTFSGTNPGTSGSKKVTLSANGASGVTGTLAIPIVDDDQVTVTATVDPSITFDIDTATSDTESAAPYSVALGTLTSGAVTGSNESTVNSIWLDLNTNASGGAVVTVKSANGSLKSTSTPADTIPSATAAMAAGTSNYGICVKANTATTGTLNKVSPFNSTCTTTPSGNSVGAVTTSAQNIVNSNSLPISAGRAEIMVDAAISGTQPAHNDYTDTLTFIATGTF